MNRIPKRTVERKLPASIMGRGLPGRGITID